MQHRGPILAAMCAVAVIGATLFAIAPLLPDIARDFGVSVGRAGWLIGAYSASVAVTAPIVGLLAQRLPRATVIIAGLTAFGLVWLGTLAIERFDALLALAMAAGVAGGAVLPATYAYAGDLSSFEQRGRVMGYVVTGWSLAIVVVAPLMAIAATWIDWRWVFVALAGFAWATALGLALVRKPPPVPRERATRSFFHDIGVSLLEVMRHRGTRLVLLVNLIDMGAFYGVFPYLGSEIRRNLEVGPGVAGLVIACYGLGLGVVTVNGRLLDRIGVRRSAIVTLALLALVLVAMPYASRHLLTIVPAVFVWGILQGAFFTAITALATEQIPRLRGVVTAILSCSTYLGMTLYIALAGVVFETWGYPTMGVISGLTSLAGALLLARLAR